MLEIILVWTLAKKIGNIVQEKGHARIGYQLLLVVFWIGGEVAGAVVGALLQGDGGEGGFPCMVYLCALAGAGCGAGLAFAIAGSLSNVKTDADYYGEDKYDRRLDNDARRPWRAPQDQPNRDADDQITDRPPQRREDDRFQE